MNKKIKYYSFPIRKNSMLAFLLKFGRADRNEYITEFLDQWYADWYIQKNKGE